MGDERKYYCNGCKAYLDSTHFYPSSIRCGETRCKYHGNEYRKKRLRNDPNKLLQWKLYKSESRREKGTGSVKFQDLETIKRIVEQYGGKSALSKKEDGLMIVRYYLDLPISQYPWNGVMMTQRESKSLPRTTINRHIGFPKWIREEMEERRCAIAM